MQGAKDQDVRCHDTSSKNRWSYLQTLMFPVSQCGTEPCVHFIPYKLVIYIPHVRTFHMNSPLEEELSSSLVSSESLSQSGV